MKQISVVFLLASRNSFALNERVWVQLTREGYLCLLDHVRPGSAAYDVLKRAVKFTGIGQEPEWYTIDSDLDITEILLTIALVHCPAASKPLEHSIRELKARTTRKS